MFVQEPAVTESVPAVVQETEPKSSVNESVVEELIPQIVPSAEVGDDICVLRRTD